LSSRIALATEDRRVRLRAGFTVRSLPGLWMDAMDLMDFPGDTAGKLTLKILYVQLNAACNE
jgi:hypothetical protein